VASQSHSSVSYAPNTERKHTRGRRGKVTPGITDLQADFEAGLFKDTRGERRQVSRQVSQAKTALANAKKFARKGFRGKKTSTKPSRLNEDAPVVFRFEGPKPTVRSKRELPVRGMRAKTDSEREEFARAKAHKRRVQLGLEGLSRAQRRKRASETTSTSTPFNLKASLAQFKRTGKLPAYPLDVVCQADSSGLDARALKRMIGAMLIRAGVEENPGPPMLSSSTDPPPDGIPMRWVKKPTSRDKEKEDRCGGNAPREKERLDAKKSRGRANFSVSSLLNAAQMLDHDKKVGNDIAAKEKAEDESERKSAHMRELFTDVRPAFVMRSGGFSRPWYAGFGVPQTRLRLIGSMLQYLSVWFSWLRGLGNLPLWDPRDGSVWRDFSPEDNEFMTPVFKGLVFSTFALIALGIVFAMGILFTWIFSFSSLLQWIAIVISWIVRSGAIVQLFSMCFRPILRYQTDDRMVSYGATRFHSSDPDFESTMRMSGSRYRPATDAPVLCTVHMHNITFADHTSWYQRYWATSWCFGSLFTWLESNRLQSLVQETVDVIVSMRIVDTVLTGLARSRIDSYRDAETKARNIVSTYDELQLGIQQVRGRNVREDSIQYATALYWSRAAADASLGNGVIPHSD